MQKMVEDGCPSAKIPDCDRLGRLLALRSLGQDIGVVHEQVVSRQGLVIVRAPTEKAEATVRRLWPTVVSRASAFQRAYAPSCCAG